MIDASSFATLHNAFWAEHAPTSEHFVRRLNLEYTERWSPPIDKPREKIRAAFVSEFAFARFCGRASGLDPSQLDTAAFTETKKRLIPLMDDSKELDLPLSLIEKNQVKHLEESLVGFFGRRGKELYIRPIFKGCGYVDSSEADVISGSCLFEIKAVDRPFRSVDIKQLVTYYALNHASRQFDLESIGIFNPRRSVWFEMNFDEVSREISGQSAQELCDNVVLAVSSGDISR
ncbi:hypothetical protein [Gluconacetobacter asukensis]|uniref:Uncharacterized protein n=1 Tax=Gluconacetobacter asukensis TaxID=1017181 RepID=A0A7W4P414_9PROT|nr:hypothetical protein [Gluconacetobacter asukensis]MBB2173265.1 hypothetical protein [Gluconacetobacter asukensis]